MVVENATPLAIHREDSTLETEDQVALGTGLEKGEGSEGLALGSGSGSGQDVNASSDMHGIDGGEVVHVETAGAQPGDGHVDTHMSDTGEYDEGFGDTSIDDSDSAVGGVGSYATSTYTVNSSFADEIVEENGRTYHVYKDGKYMLPNDEIELNRLDMQHKMWSITLDKKLHLAPIGENPQDVLDIATGTGIWAIEFAEAYPSAIVTGTDLSFIQPKYIPPNLQFLIEDAEDPWLFPQKFDYIHGRTLATCFKHPPNIIASAYEALKPGGWLELQDMCLQTSDDGSLEGTPLKKWQEYVQEATAFTGVPWTNVPNYKRWLIEAGFEDVREVHFRWPSNQWSTDRKERLLGAWTQAQIDNGMLESVSTRLFRAKLGWSEERLAEFLAEVRKVTKDGGVKAYSPVSVVCGRKPLSTI